MDRSSRPQALVLPDADDADFDRVVQRLLEAVREHLDLDVAFIGEVTDGARVFRYVDSRSNIDLISPGVSDPIDESYCGHVLSGALPEFIRDPRQHPVAERLAGTDSIPVGTHLSVPIRLSDGRVYGTFCCFAFDVRDDLVAGDVRAVRMVAELAGEFLEAMHAARDERRDRRDAVRAIVDDPHSIELVFQPLWDLRSMTVVAVEALSRFPGRVGGPAWHFAEAAAVGLGIDLELRAFTLALEALHDVPDPVRLNVNVSPETLLSPVFFDLITGCPPGRLVVEVTEHAVVEDYTEMRAVSDRLSRHGVWLSIDDVGRGFSGLHRILESEPEELKLDGAVIRDVDTNPVKQALVEAFCTFGKRVGFQVVAEGIESEAELAMLKRLGASIGQGYHLARPGALADALDAVAPA